MRIRTATRVLAAAAALTLPLVLVATPPAAAEDEGPALTVYSSADPAGFDPQQYIGQARMGRNPQYAAGVPGFGVVKDVRTFTLTEGLNELRITDVAQFIDPTTVSITDLTSPGDTAVLEQAFRFDLASPLNILERYVGERIGLVETIEEKQVRVEGELLSATTGQLVLRTDDGLRFLHMNHQGLRLPKLPEGLLTKPTLVWKVATETAGEHRLRSAYQTSGLTWRTDYNVVLNATDTKADIGAWVTLLNLSGASYRNARLKLIAGDVQRVRAPQTWGGPSRGRRMAKAEMDGGFQEKSFFEYHLYTLPRRTDVVDNATQQITLFPTASEVGVEKVLVYYGLPGAANWGYAAQPHGDRQLGLQMNKKLDVYVRFKNEKSNKMGVPLPKGKVRVYKQDPADETLEFIGEDLIDHTPKDEEVLIRLGQAFDVVGERIQQDFKVDRSGHEIIETIEIKLRNHKDTAVKVIVKENLYRWVNWKILESTLPHEKQDSRTIHFDVEVAPDAERVLTYTVRYTW